MFFVAQSGLSYFIGMSRSSGDRDCRIPGAILAPMPPAEIVTGTLSELEDALADAVVHAREPDPLAPVTVVVGHVLAEALPAADAGGARHRADQRALRAAERAGGVAVAGERSRASAALARGGAAAGAARRRIGGRLLRGDRRPRRVHRSADAAVSRVGAGRLRRPGAASPGAARRRSGRQPREVRRAGGALRRLLRPAPRFEAHRDRRAVCAGRHRATRRPGAGLRALGAVRVADAADRAHRDRAPTYGVHRAIRT